MTDNPGYYSQWYNSNPEASNPFGVEALRLTPDSQMHAFLAAGGILVQWLMREKKS